MRPYTVAGNLLIRVLFNDAAVNISSGSWTTTEVVMQVSGYMNLNDKKHL
jgi:hypothetical protein